MSRLTLLAPVRAVHEVAPIVAAGATRLYCGVSPVTWTGRYRGAVWLTRRPPSSDIPDVRALAAVAGESRARGVAVDLALNAPALPAEEVDRVAGLGERAVRELGVDRIVAADPALLVALGERGVPFVASTVFGACNAEALRLLGDLGAVGAVLPRQLRLGEVRTIARAVPGLDLECLVLLDGCAWEEGLCRTTHAVPGGALCAVDWDLRVEGADPAERAAWEETMSDFRSRLPPPDHCALCAVPALAAAGVRTLKVAGRQGPFVVLERAVRMLRAVVDAARTGGRRAARERARALRATPETCASGRACAFPLRDRREAR